MRTTSQSKGRDLPNHPATGTISLSDAEALFLTHLPLITRLTQAVARRRHLSPDDAEDFTSIVYLRFIENDYAILRKFQGRSTLRTFLIVVIHRICLDHQIREWGKWRPSESAKRQGDAAVTLERLVTRDGLTLDEAAAVMTMSPATTPSRETLAEVASRLRARPCRRPVAADAMLEDIADNAPAAVLARVEVGQHATRARRALARALITLDPSDRRLIDLHFHRGLAIAQIARTLRVEQRPLYTRRQRILARLRSALERDPSIAGILRDLLRG
jgi:RNA polymerase sigma factor (sigma-70 family)